MAFETQQEVVTWFKDFDPKRVLNKSDEEIYGMASDWVFQNYGKEIKPYKPIAPSYVEGQPLEHFPEPEGYLEKVDTSPESIIKLHRMANNIDISDNKTRLEKGQFGDQWTDYATSSLVQKFVETGHHPWGVPKEWTSWSASPEFFKYAYNHSMAGLAYAAINGEEAYDYGDYEPSAMAEVGALVLGLYSVPELAAFVTTSGVGNLAARGGVNVLSRFGLAGLKVVNARKVGKRAFLANMIEGGIGTGVSLGGLGAAHGTAASAAEQRMSTIDDNPDSPTYGKGIGKIDPHKTALDAGEAFLESFVIGVPAGIVKGAMAAQYGMASLAKNPGIRETVTKALTGTLGQTSAEILSFTALPNLYKQLGISHFKDQPNIMSTEWKQQLFGNAAVIGHMAAFSKGWRKLKGVDDSHTWSNQILRQAHRDIKQIQGKTDDVAAHLRESGIDFSPELQEQINKLYTKEISDGQAVRDYELYKDQVYEILQKPRNEWTKDEFALVSEKGLSIVLSEVGLWAELRENPEAFRQILNELAIKEGKKEISNREFEAYKKILTHKINEYSDIFESLGKEIAIDWDDRELKDDEVRLVKTEPFEITDSRGKVVETKYFTKTVKKNSEDYNTRMNNEFNEDGSPAWKVEGAPDRVTPIGEPIVKGQSLEDRIINIVSGKIDEQTRKMYEMYGAADVQAAIDKIAELRGVKRKTTTAGKPDWTKKGAGVEDPHIGAKNLLDYMELKPGEHNYTPKLDNERTLSAIIDWMISGNKSSSEGKHLVEFMKWAKIENPNDINIGHVKNYFKYMEENNIPIKPRLTAISQFFRHGDQKRFFRRNWTDQSFGDMWADLTTREGFRAKEIRTVVAEVIEVLGGHDKVNEGVVSKITEKGTPEERAYALSHMLDGFGLRTGEVNKLRARNLKSDGDYYFLDIDFLAKKGTSFQREIPITKRLYDALKGVISDKNIGKDDLIFGGEKNASKLARAVLEKTGISKEMLRIAKEKDIDPVKEQMDEFSRKFTESFIKRQGFRDESTTNIINMTMGHSKFTDKYYGILQTAGSNRAVMKVLRRWMDGKLSAREAEKLMRETAEGKHQWETDVSPENVREFSEWLDRKLKENPGLVIRKLEDARYTGRFATGIIDVVMGKSNKLTFFHENAHRLKAMIDSTGNKSLSKLWKQAEKIFAKEFTPEIEKKYEKYKKKDRLEEFIADELAKYSLGREQSTTMRSKMKSWASRLWSNIKRVIFGKERLTKRDMQNILGNKVYKGFATSDLSASVISKYKIGPVDSAKRLKEDFNYIAKKAGVNLRTRDKKELIEMIAREAGIENPESFKLGNSTMSEADMELFGSKLDEIPFERLKGDAYLIERFRIREDVNLVLKETLSPKQTENLLLSLGVSDGSMWTATKEQLKTFQDIVYGLHDPKRNKDRVGWLRSSQGEGELAETMAKMDGILGYVAEKSLPVGEVIKMLGLDKLGAKLESHVDVELHHIGQFILFEKNAQRLVGKDWNGVFWKGLKDSFVVVMDAERYIERLETGKLTSKEKHLMSKAFKSDYIVEKDGKYIKNPKYKGGKIRDAFNTNNKEGQVVELWKNYTDHMHEAFETAVKNNLTEVEWLNFKEDNNINWIKDGIYVSRLVTTDFKRHFNIHGRNMEKLIEEQAVPIARELAQKKHKSPTEEQIFNEMEAAKTVVKHNLYDLFNFGKGRHQSRFLKKRHVKLPEFVETKDGKTIKVYETSYEKTLKQYALGMSKFLANVEVFPEYVKLKGFHFPGAKAEIAELQIANPKWGNWVKEQVESQLGYGKNWTDYGDMFTRSLGNFAQILAKTQLSFPLSGLKNLLLGQAATMQAFKVTDWFRSLGTTMSKEFRDEVRAMAGTEVGLRHIDEFVPFVQKPLNWIFKAGFMKPTENFNRYMSVAASRLQQARLVSRITGNKISSRKSKKAINRLKGFYKLTDGEVNLLKKYGLGGVEGHTFKSSYEKLQIKRNVEKVYQKMDTMAHINTQGASMKLFMPKWAEGRIARPMTLFKRMAYASTVNTFRNLGIAFKNGDYGRLIATMIGPLVTGATLVAIYDLLLGVETPKQNSSWAKYLYYTAMRGESLGVLSDFLRYFEGEGAEMTMYPAVYNWLDSAIFQIGVPVFKGTKTVPQGGHDFAMKTLGAYRGVMNIMYKKNNDFNRGMSKYRNMYYDEFWKEMYPNDIETYLGERQLSRRSPYYRDFKETFYKGTREQFAKSAITMVYAVAVDLYNEGVDSNGQQTKYADFNDAMKRSISILKTKLKTLNPNPGTARRGNKRISLAWYKWLNKNPEKGKQWRKELQALENEYDYKIRLFKNEDFSKYIKDPEIRNFINKELKKLK